MPTITIPIEALKSPIDQNLPFYSWKEPIGTTPIVLDIFNKFGVYCKAVIITNNDSANAINAINLDPSNPVEVIPPNTKGEDDSWTNFISVTPDAVTGKGLLELQLVKPEDALKNPKLTQAQYERMVML